MTENVKRKFPDKDIQWVWEKENWTNEEWAEWQVFYDIDLRTQLSVIKKFIARIEKYEKEVEQEIDSLQKEARSEKYQRDRLYDCPPDDRWVDRLYFSSFEDAANSAVAVALLAPFIEALFSRAFRVFQQRSMGDLPSEDFLKKKGESVFDHASRVSCSIGLEKFFPKDYRETLEALFFYRNAVFHNGIEWPEDELKTFRCHTQRKEWPEEWFFASTSDGEPWLFSVSAEFIQHCLQTIHGIIDGTGAYIFSEVQSSRRR